tara:strand:+ start:19367 stop:19885 length:519 start_codon:yes stop_codon:yes gene_type:complete
MERFDVKRGLIKSLDSEGGLVALASRFFEVVEKTGNNSFSGSHGIMTSIDGHYNESGALIVDVTNVPPNFDDPDSVKLAMDARKRWTQFLDEATGYNSKQRGDKAKEWAKKASKAKSAVSAARHFMSMSNNLDSDVISKAEELISEIEMALEANDNTKAAGRGEKLNKLLTS